MIILHQFTTYIPLSVPIACAFLRNSESSASKSLEDIEGMFNYVVLSVVKWLIESIC